MSVKHDLASEVEALPESVELEEAFERLYRAFRLKHAGGGAPRSAVAQGASGMTDETVPAQTEDRRLEAVRSLVEAGRVEAARQLLTIPGGPRTAAWAELLAEPRVSIGRTDDLQAGEEPAFPDLTGYAGRWVALRRGQVIGAEVSRSALRAQLGQAGLLDGALFLRVP